MRRLGGYGCRPDGRTIPITSMRSPSIPEKTNWYCVTQSHAVGTSTPSGHSLADGSKGEPTPYRTHCVPGSRVLTGPASGTHLGVTFHCRPAYWRGSVTFHRCEPLLEEVSIQEWNPPGNRLRALAAVYRCLAVRDTRTSCHRQTPNPAVAPMCPWLISSGFFGVRPETISGSPALFRMGGQTRWVHGRDRPASRLWRSVPVVGSCSPLLQ